MTVILNNDDVKQVLNMDVTMAALDTEMGRARFRGYEFDHDYILRLFR